MPLPKIEQQLRVIARECIASGQLPCDPRHEFRFHMLLQSVWQLECARDDYLEKHP
jgi:hypothetical protein